MSVAEVVQKKSKAIGSETSALLLQRKCACGGTVGIKGERKAYKRNRLLGKPLQPKLILNESGNVYEKQAERVAEQVMHMPNLNLTDTWSNTPADSLSLRRITGNEKERNEAPQIVHDVLSLPGKPLDGETRSYFEPRFGHDFGEVRVHTDAQAARSADRIHAEAYTAGNDVVIGAGWHKMTSADRRRLIAHELTHVVQQGRTHQSVGVVQRSPVFPDASCESGKIETKIAEYVTIALDLVKYTVDQMAHPERVVGPLRRFFHFDPTIPGQMIAAPTIYSTLHNNLVKLQNKLAEPVNTYCETGATARGSRGWAELDNDSGLVKPEKGITYNRNSLRLITLPRQIINTIIHEYAHLVGIGHHQPPGEPISNEYSTRVKGLTTLEALNNAESYMRFVRAVTSKRKDTSND